MKNRHPTVVAYLALFIALGGTGYAASKIGSAQITNNSIKSVDVKNRSLLAKDFKAGQLPAGAPGQQGLPGAKGDKGDPGTNGTNGTNGIDATARGYAWVTASGVLPAGRSKGVIAVNKAAAGVYCFDLDFTPVVAVASAFSNNNATATVTTDADNGTGDGTCATALFPHDAVVVTRGSNDATSTPADITFSVIFQ
jgi:hypothetical protein